MQQELVDFTRQVNAAAAENDDTQAVKSPDETGKAGGPEG